MELLLPSGRISCCISSVPAETSVYHVNTITMPNYIFGTGKPGGSVLLFF